MCVRTAAEANADGKRRRPRAFYRRTVQTARFLKGGAGCFQGGVYHTVAEEARP